MCVFVVERFFSSYFISLPNQLDIDKIDIRMVTVHCFKVYNHHQQQQQNENQ